MFFDYDTLKMVWQSDRLLFLIFQISLEILILQKLIFSAIIQLSCVHNKFMLLTYRTTIATVDVRCRSEWSRKRFAISTSFIGCWQNASKPMTFVSKTLSWTYYYVKSTKTTCRRAMLCNSTCPSARCSVGKWNHFPQRITLWSGILLSSIHIAQQF